METVAENMYYHTCLSDYFSVRLELYFLFIDKVYALIQLGTCLTLPLLRLYNGKRGSIKGIGKLFYIYYPLHLAVCGVIRVVL